MWCLRHNVVDSEEEVHLEAPKCLHGDAHNVYRGVSTLSTGQREGKLAFMPKYSKSGSG